MVWTYQRLFSTSFLEAKAMNSRSGSNLMPSKPVLPMLKGHLAGTSDRDKICETVAVRKDLVQRKGIPGSWAFPYTISEHCKV